jgi:hypothetical protein
MLAKRITPISSIAKRDFHLKGNEKRLLVRIAGASSTVFIVSTEAVPKVDNLYCPSSDLVKSSPRFSMWYVKWELETPSVSSICEKVIGFCESIRRILRRAGCFKELNMVE